MPSPILTNGGLRIGLTEVENECHIPVRGLGLSRNNGLMSLDERTFDTVQLRTSY